MKKLFVILLSMVAVSAQAQFVTGGGSGKTAATAIGAVVGAMAGNSVGGQGTGSVQNRAICSYVPVQTQIGKTLTILFEGRQYHIQTP